MAEYEVELTSGAEGDLEHLFMDTLERAGEGSARGLLDELWKSIKSLRQNPLRRAVPSQLRALGVLEYRQMLSGPYRLLFKVEEQRVIIYLIAHEKRDFRSLLERRLLR